MPTTDNRFHPRVLFITRKWPPAVGGMETYSRELTADLAQLVDLDVRALPGRSDGHPPNPIRLLLFLINNALFLWKRRRHYDIVHFGDFVLFPLAWWHWLWSPDNARFISVHGLDLIYGNRSGLAPALYRRFISWARRRDKAVTCFFANSRNTARITKESGFSKVSVVPLGVRLPQIDAMPSQDTPRGERYVLFIGRLVRRKGASWFAEQVLPKLPADIKLYIVGKVWDQEEATRLKSNSRVRMLGFVPDDELGRIRSAACAVVMPNLFSEGNTDVEGFGLVALEAAANQSIVLAADLEGLSDAVRHSETGFLIEPGNAFQWAERINEILDWDFGARHTFVERTRSSLENYYSWARVATDIFSGYKDYLVIKSKITS